MLHRDVRDTLDHITDNDSDLGAEVSDGDKCSELAHESCVVHDDNVRSECVAEGRNGSPYWRGDDSDGT